MAEREAPVRGSPPTLEAVMRQVSLLVSVVALALMIAGFFGLVFTGQADTLPGASVLPLVRLPRLGEVSLPLAAVSAGIALLALLPSVRVLLAAWAYLRDRDLLDMVVALLVLAELIFSATLGE